MSAADNEEIAESDNETELDNEQNEEEPTDAGEVSDYYLDTGDYVFEIKEIEQMESSFEDGIQIIAIEMSFTNNSNEPVSPWMAQGFNAEQETDVTVETLMGANGMFPDGYKTELVDMGDTNVKLVQQ
ncbi:hypothetical protein JCM19055_4639 [Geomicrobium sp. JCM 19055]|nr:hypothetical protein JCM19055_4639 [Geomicrobium sp. JCM 19055]